MLVVDPSSRIEAENRTALAVKGEGRQERELELYDYLRQRWPPSKHESRLA